MQAHTWAETLEIERQGEAVLDAIFGVDFIIVRATRAHQRQKIDRFHIHRKDGRIIHRVDYKVEPKAGVTGNLAIEHISVEQDKKVIAHGWVHTTIADIYVSYVPARDAAYVLSIKRLRDRWSEIQATFKLTATWTHGSGREYISRFYPVPIEWLDRNGFIEKTLLAVNAQLRLDLRMPKREASH